jgi:hypothetical protein
LSKDYERKVQSSEAFVEVTTIRLMLQWLTQGSINLTNSAFGNLVNKGLEKHREVTRWLQVLPQKPYGHRQDSGAVIAGPSTASNRTRSSHLLHGSFTPKFDIERADGILKEWRDRA